MIIIFINELQKAGEWKGKFAITRGGNGSFIAHVAALRAKWGDQKMEEWMRAVAQNTGVITKWHGDIRKAVGSGGFTCMLPLSPSQTLVIGETVHFDLLYYTMIEPKRYAVSI